MRLPKGINDNELIHYAESIVSHSLIKALFGAFNYSPEL